MKKRLLALALCLVLATSLLPVTAAATDYKINSASITSSGWRKGDLGLGYDVYQLNITDWKLFCGDTTIQKDNPYFQTLSLISYDKESKNPLQSTPVAGVTYYVRVLIAHFWNETGNTYAKSDSEFGADLKITGAEGFQTTLISAKTNNLFGDPAGVELLFTMVKEDVHKHNWDLDMTQSSVTATCLNGNCPIGSASLTLDAHSVTLPDSPFNARVILKGITEEQIKEEFGFTIGPIRYKFKAPGESTFTDVTPADGAREGTYQAAVTLSPMQIAASYALNEDGATNQGPIFGNDGSITLYTQYTAVNPEVTAQTGDNRPIELMMAGVLVFSALAAAAFILDSKRKYSR